MAINFDFLVSLVMLSDVLKKTKVVCEALQRINIDLVEATTQIRELMDDFGKWRTSDSETFGPLFKEAEELAIIADVQVRMPRVIHRQINRPNATGDGSPEDHYRLNSFLPFLDHIQTEFRYRFDKQGDITSGLTALLPSYFVKYDFTTLKPAADHFSSFLPDDSDMIESEYESWRRFCERKTDMPMRILDVLSNCDSNFFPNIHILLRIFATLPVTTCTGERTFSTLAYLKNYRRSTMAEERLNGLALMEIHRELTAEPTAENGIISVVIKRFCQGLARRLPLQTDI